MPICVRVGTVMHEYELKCSTLASKKKYMKAYNEKVMKNVLQNFLVFKMLLG